MILSYLGNGGVFPEPAETYPGRRGLPARTILSLNSHILSLAPAGRLTKPDGVITITGRGLPPEGGDSGISLKNAAGAETPVTNPLALKNPKKLIVQLPAALAPGAYRLVIRTRFNRAGGLYSTLRIGESDFTVTVEPAKH